MSWAGDGGLKCDGAIGCAAEITHLDQDGFIYCGSHGAWRRQYPAANCNPGRSDTYSEASH